MSQRWFALVLAVALGIGSLAGGKTIVWVSDNKAPANGVPADQAWVDLLIAQGYTVDLSMRNKEARALDATEIATLNAADLVIISRDADSGQYDDGTEPADWNAITAPIMYQIAQFTQNNRHKWINASGVSNGRPTLEAVIPTHPIFKGVPLGANNQIGILTINADFPTSTDAGNGTLIAKRADNGQPWIVEWAPGVEYYAGAGYTAGGMRLLFIGGAKSGAADGTYNYNDDGKKMFLNAVKYLLGIKPAASEPEPAKGAVDVPRDPVLSWKPMLPGQKHDVYLGTGLEDVDAATVADPRGVLASTGQDANTFEPAALLQYGRTYYWRIDEVNTTPDGTVFKGEIWSFTAEPFSYPIANVTAAAPSASVGAGPENTVNGSGLDPSDRHSTDVTQMWLSAGAQPNWILYQFDRVYKLDELWVWNYNQQNENVIGFGAKDVAVEYSTDGVSWVTLPDVPVFGPGTGSSDYAHNTTVDFGGVFAQYVKLTINSTWGAMTKSGLSEVRFFYVPLQAREPAPMVGATAQELDVVLNWRPGHEAASHQVYLDPDPNAVANGTVPATTMTDHSYSPGTLNLGTTYYWRVDEVNDAASPSVWAGEVWSFATREYLVIDDFESYNDEDESQGMRIYQTWLDGLVNGTTATVGNWDPPFAERTIIHGGQQAMPLDYNNINAPYYAQAERDFTPPQNWTSNGADTLSLWVRGNPVAYVDDAGTVTMSGAGHDIWNTADDFRFAYKSLTGNGSITVQVESLTNTNSWAKAGVMIRQNLDADSKFVYLIVSYSQGVSLGWRQLPATDCSSVTQAGVAAPQWVKLTRTGDVFTAQYSADGQTWLDLRNADGTVASTTVMMTGTSVYAGLCVTSHNTAEATTAVFSGAAITGGVTGGWQVTAIGDDPQPTNSPGVFYVTVQDSAGKTATVTHPTAVTTGTWTQWLVPLDSLTGINAGKVKRLYLGVDNRANSAQRGAGRIYLDDIGFGRPAQ